MDTVLIVDDNDMVRRTLERIMKRAGYDVVLASDGGEGFAHIRAGRKFVLIITDVDMPGMNGVDMTKWITEHLDHMGERVPPFIFFSGSLTEEVRQQVLLFLDEQNVAFLRKPLNFHQELLDAIELLLKRATEPLPNN